MPMGVAHSVTQDDVYLGYMIPKGRGVLIYVSVVDLTANYRYNNYEQYMVRFFLAIEITKAVVKFPSGQWPTIRSNIGIRTYSTPNDF